jgi:hypothetical protein
VNPADLGKRYDLVAAYGDLPGGTHAPVTPHVAVVINPTASPLSDPSLLNLLRHSLNPQSIVDSLAIAGAVSDTVEFSPPIAIRTELANAGWPDGLVLSIAYAAAPGAPEIAEQLVSVGINSRLSVITKDDLNTAFDGGIIQAAFITWETPDERQAWVSRFGDANVIDLYTVPISYLAVRDLTITFTPGGWPIPAS